MLLSLILVLGIAILSVQSSEDAAFIPDPIENRLMEMESKFHSLISKSNKEVKTTLEDLMKDHISLKTKFEKLDSEHVALKNDMNKLRKQNEHLAIQVLKLQNDSFGKSEKPLCKCETSGKSFAKMQKNNDDFPQEDMFSENNDPEFEERKLTVQEKRGEETTAQIKAAPNDMSKRTPFLRKSNTHKTGLRRSTPDIPSFARVAFFARMSRTLTNPGDNQRIEFSDVVTNAGNAYDGATGTFVCPVAGTYVFFASILSYTNKWVETSIVRNGNELSYTYSNNPNNYDSGSNMAVVELQENDIVWVRTHDVYHSSGNVARPGHSTFSGFILWENY